MELGIFMMLTGILWFLAMIYEELKAIRAAISSTNTPTRSQP